MSGRLQQIIGESGYIGLIKRGSARACRELQQWRQLFRAKYSGSYSKKKVSNELASHITLKSIDDCYAIPSQVVTHYLNHEFDLLGSGWVHIFYGMSCRGLEQYCFKMSKPVKTDRRGIWLKGRINHSNLLTAQKIWQHISPDYQPIDWQLDFKSGYRWSEMQWSKKIRIGNIKGVDIKVPWELARMQHLPQLALSCLSLNYSQDEKNAIFDECQNQLLDFIATNPPGFGVNWFCPMDIAIRAVNWLMARDIFLSGQMQFQAHMENLLAKSIYEHGQYIIANLEWNPLRANHYLANITGLAFIAAYLPSSPETDTWLAFAVQELIVEVDRQFHPDGGNFEGSTSYHRLSAEMVFYATALIVGLPKERLDKLCTYNHALYKNRGKTPYLKPAPMPFYPLPEQERLTPFPMTYFERLERIAEFIMDITKPSGEIPQIGDNDSGRFLKLAPIYQQLTVSDACKIYVNLDNYKASSQHSKPPTFRGLTAGSMPAPDEALYFMENHLDCRHTVATGAGLFERPDFTNWLNNQANTALLVDDYMIRALAKGQIPSQATKKKNFLAANGKDMFEASLLHLSKLPQDHCQKFEFVSESGDLLNGLTRHTYPDFGLFIFRSARLYLAVRCWIADEPLHSSHRHYDQLSIELVIDNVELIKDPGTYLYTPIPDERCRYRSNESHFSPFSSTEVSDGHLTNVFRSIQLEKVSVIYCGDEGFMGEGKKEGSSLEELHQLAIFLGNTSVVIYHAYNKPYTKSSLLNKPFFSSGYGIKQRHGVNLNG